MVLKQLDYKQQSPTLIYVDNLLALKMINDNKSPTEQARHIGIRYFALQEWKLDGSIIMIHVKGVLNPSDGLTKPLGYILRSRHCCQIMGHMMANFLTYTSVVLARQGVCYFSCFTCILSYDDGKLYQILPLINTVKYYPISQFVRPYGHNSYINTFTKSSYFVSSSCFCSETTGSDTLSTLRWVSVCWENRGLNFLRCANQSLNRSRGACAVLYFCQGSSLNEFYSQPILIQVSVLFISVVHSVFTSKQPSFSQIY